MKRLFAAMLFCSLCQVGCNHFSSGNRDQDSLIRAGDRVQAAGDPDSAIGVYKSALDKTPGHKLPIYLKLGESYMSAGRIDEAKRTYEEALPLDENDEVKKQLGRLYLSIGDPDLAISIFEGITLVHKDDIKALNGLGVAYDLKGEHETAQNYYHQALQVNAEDEPVKSNLGLSLAFAGKYEEALKILQPMGEALGATSKQRHNLALVYALSGQSTKAQETFAKDMGTAQINDTLHTIHMAPRPKMIPKPALPKTSSQKPASPKDGKA